MRQDQCALIVNSEKNKTKKKYSLKVIKIKKIKKIKKLELLTETVLLRQISEHDSTYTYTYTYTFANIYTYIYRIK